MDQGPTTPDIPENSVRPPTPLPTYQNDVISFTANPPANSILQLGDTFEYTINYEVEGGSLWVGVAFVRDDGEEYFNTSGGAHNVPGQFSWGGTRTLSDSNRDTFYKFAKGHRVNGLFVMGHPPLHGATQEDPNGFVIKENVVHSEVIPLFYRIE